jgi:hypothetical protein
VGEQVALPELLPTQVTSLTTDAFGANTPGCVTVTAAVAMHPNASVTDTVYDPALALQ